MLLPAFLALAALQIAAAQTEFASWSDPAAAGMAVEDLDKGKKDLHALVTDGKLAGATYAIVRDGKVVSHEALGYADIEEKIPVRADTIFRVFSQSKPVSTAGILTMVDEKKIGLDDRVSKYIPEFGAMKVIGKNEKLVKLDRPMTIRHLLTHTSGITYGFMDNTPCDQIYNKNNILNPEEVMADKVKRIAQMPLCSQPGSKWQYGLSTDVLAYIAAKVANSTIPDFYQQRLFGPLKMKDTGFWVPEEKASRLSVVYQTDGKNITRPPPDPNNVQLVDYTKEPKYLAAGGGLVSTLNDYVRFGQMLLNGGELDGVRVLKPETVKLMTTPQIPDKLLPLVYNPKIIIRDMTFGWGVGIGIPHNETNNYPRPGEITWGGGMSTNFWVSPKDKTVIVFMTQIIPFTNDPKRAVRDWTYKAIDLYQQTNATAVKEMAVPAADSHSLRGSS